MKILKVGDSKQLACAHCNSFQEVTFLLRDVPFSNGKGTVKNVLAGVCNKCDSIAVLPHQSTPVIKMQMDVQRKSLESRVPAHMVDILNLVSFELGGGVEFVPNILKFYIHSLSNQSISPNNIAQYLSTNLAKGAAQKRISLKGQYLEEDIQSLKALTHIKNTTDLIKSIVLKINDDVLVKKRKIPIKQLKNIMAATV